MPARFPVEAPSVAPKDPASATSGPTAVDPSCRGSALSWRALYSNPACRTTPEAARGAAIVEGLRLSVDVSPTRLRNESFALVSATLHNTTTSAVTVRIVVPDPGLGSVPIDVEVDAPLTALFDGPTPPCFLLGADVPSVAPMAVELELDAGGTLVFPDAMAEFRLPPIDESCAWRPFPKGKHIVRVSVEVSAGEHVRGSASVEVRR